ncbi:MAG: membrane integrity-associated transporter subunit PqiC [Deltaproteobacteria bacterium]|jgi:uncharacterized lipoprotein YmbA|nr:membrane integrity-associated transporter subunit PqiC [Deltaproteobacteria bacterium]
MTSKKPRRFIGRIVISIIAIALLNGCRTSSPPVEFYTLMPVIDASEEKTEANVRENLSVGVGPMEMPKSIDRPQLVTRSAPNVLSVDEFHRWAGSLREDFIRALTANLAVLLKTDQITAYPWENYFLPDYRIFLDVHRFDGELGNQMVLDITCTITDREGRRALYVHKSRIEEPLPDTDFGTLVSAKNKTIATLSRQLARIIIKLESGAI